MSCHQPAWIPILTPQQNRMQIYVARAGQQTGPFSLEEVRSMLDSGRIALTDLAWKEGLESWQPLDRVLNITPSPLANQPAPASDALPEALSLNSSRPASFGIRFVAHIVD